MNLIKKLSPLWLPFTEPKIQIYAAAASFHLILSALPAGALFLSLIPNLTFPQSFWSVLINGIIPRSLTPIISALLQKIYNARSISVISFSALLTLWSASNGILAVMDGINASMSLNRLNGYIRRRLLSMLYFVFFLFALIIALFTFVLGNLLISFWQTLRNNAVLFLLYRLRAIISAAILSAVFYFMYRILPSQKLEKRFCLYSAFVVSLSWIIFSGIFSFYIEHISNFKKLYGSIGLLILMGLWLKICISVLLYGGVFAKLKSEGAYSPFNIIASAFKRKI